MEFSRRFLRYQWVALISLFLVICAGSFVRITGSGMGCPDWPKCFGQWIPPTAEEQLPSNYLAIFQEKRSKKAVKFCKFLTSFGMKETAEKIKNDPTLLKEEPFNAARTYTEYINRLLGFLAGNIMLIGFIWSLIYYRSFWLIGLSFLNLILMGIEAWFGSIVVATNLVPWTITVHMFLALVILLIQLHLIYRISPRHNKTLQVQPVVYYVWWSIFAITFYQMFLGTQVREYIDELTKQGLGRDAWSDKFGMEFFIHRSFSWLVLILLAYVGWKNEKSGKLSIIRWALGILSVELLAGVCLAYFDLPGLVQTAHLLFATVLLGILGMGIYRFKKI
ncbi:MAG: COX15/CtaA family protein [Flavobacteriales bacterium]|jgi:cytochrome c oxidase assembly protein subunit 15